MKRHSGMLNQGDVPNLHFESGMKLSEHMHHVWGGNLAHIKVAGGHRRLRDAYRKMRRDTAKRLAEQNLRANASHTDFVQRVRKWRIFGRVRHWLLKFLRSFIF